MKSSSGITLIEAMVTLAVTGLIMTFLAMAISLSYQRFRTSSQRHDRQQQVLLFSQRLGIDLRRAPLGSVTAFYPSANPASGDLALSIPTPLTADGNYQRAPDGGLLYQAYSLYYREAVSSAIHWQRVPLAGATTVPAAQTAANINTALSSVSGRRLVDGPAEWRLLDAAGVGTEAVTDPTRLQVVLQGVSGPGRLPFTFVVDPPG
jgi:type II secretory pathway pseudopilin PulG